MMALRDISASFRRTSALIIAVICGFTLTFAADVILGLQWGYSTHDLYLALFVLISAICLRWIGLKIIAFVSEGEPED